MTLENKLFELNTLVDYGTYYLLKRNESMTNIYELREICSNYPMDEIFYEDDIKEYAKDNLDMIDEDDALAYVYDNYGIGDVFEMWDYSSFDQLDDVIDALGSDEILEYLNEDDVREYARENLDMVDGDANALDHVSANEIFEYVTNNFALGDWASWNTSKPYQE